MLNDLSLCILVAKHRVGYMEGEQLVDNTNGNVYIFVGISLLYWQCLNLHVSDKSSKDGKS